jgi:uncharacterized protein
MSFRRLIELHRYAVQTALRYNIELDEVVLTNGTLLVPHMLDEMRAEGLRLMISLDGLGDFHDCQRHLSDGSGSSDAVVRGIDLAVASGLWPDISITVSARNVEGLPELVAWVLERGLAFSLNFYRENDLSASEADLRLEEESLVNGMLAAFEVIESHLPRRRLLASLVDRANLAVPHLSPCGVGHNYLAFNHQGQVSRCQMDFAHTVTDATDPDPLARVRNSDSNFLNLSLDDKEDCRSCVWRFWCGGGCPLQTYRATGCYGSRSPNCAIYRRLFPYVIRLEGLRLLRYSDVTKVLL